MEEVTRNLYYSLLFSLYVVFLYLQLEEDSIDNFRSNQDYRDFFPVLFLKKKKEDIPVEYYNKRT